MALTATERKARLREAGVSQSTAAEKAGVKPAMVSMVINGKTRSYRVERVLAELMGLDREEAFEPHLREAEARTRFEQRGAA
ncbi:helix-turn-helix domain-containing protein [Gemmatimonas sp. UBA7669]|uniref:helix-turn-helix domain-containing protein n=1 Tax=Gemmatimonas sp. UBA7669 TaxID=1946568 RepID=UPI0025BD96F7|nr:helix-turn-helix transcriptional regulator [Gemmatimonas sp. UBA7669]